MTTPPSPAVAVVTGANGFVGSHLLVRLLERGWRVLALGRSRGGLPWRERLLHALRGASPDGTPPAADALSCVEADAVNPEGLPRGRLPGEGEAVLVHLAADTSFVPRDPAAQRLLNVEGPLRVVAALRPYLRRVLHVSTAFVAGDRTGVIGEDERDEGQGFHNPYEETKLAAEVSLAALCAREGLPLTVARPSIVVNDTRTGASSALTHLNAIVEVVNRIQEHLGIHDGEAVSREIRVGVDPGARPNMVPVDAVADALAELAASERAEGATCHLCHPSPSSNAEVLGVLLEVLGIAGKTHFTFAAEEAGRPPSYTERMLARSFRVYLPYLNDRKVFDLARAREILPGYDARFRPIEAPYLRKVIAWERAHRARRPGA